MQQHLSTAKAEMSYATNACQQEITRLAGGRLNTPAERLTANVPVMSGRGLVGCTALLQETRGWRRVAGAWSYRNDSTHPYYYA
jgi:hypothetical protein